MSTVSTVPALDTIPYLDRSESVRDLARADTYGEGIVPAAVVTPMDTAGLIDVARKLFANRNRVFVRAAGLSYLNCFRPDDTNSVVVDVSQLSGIEEINTQDGYVIVQPGCTWKTLYNALKKVGFRARFWGTFPGAVSTIGGSIAQDACHYGSALNGPAGDAVLGLEVLLPTGELVRTGSWARQGGRPFARSFGPDLTGLFINDSGAMGIKTRIALRICPIPPHVQGITIGYDSADAMIADFERTGPLRLADNIAYDRALCGARFSRQQLLALAKKSASYFQRGSLKSRLVLARAGMAGLVVDYTKYAFVAHFTIEGETAGLAREKAKLFRSRLTGAGTPLPALFPLAMAAEPFPAVSTVLGPNGEVAAPIHAKLPFSSLRECAADFESLLKSHANAMQQADVWVGQVYELIGSNEMLYEPIFYVRDRLNAQQRYLSGSTGQDERNQSGRELVDLLRSKSYEIFARHGAAHFHIGAEVPYAGTLEDSSRALLGALRHRVDPLGLLNQTALPGLVDTH
jgi:FAD/FMN-containing dehydrogenase